MSAERLRPRNYLNCFSWIFHLIYGWSTSTTLLPIHFPPLSLTSPSPFSYSSLPLPPSLYSLALTPASLTPPSHSLPIYLPMPTYLCLSYLHLLTHLSQPTYLYLPMSFNLCVSTYHHLPTYQQTYLLMSIYKQIPTYVNLPSSTYLHQHTCQCQHTIIYLPLPIPKYQYRITADPGAGISLVIVLFGLALEIQKLWPKCQFLIVCAMKISTSNFGLIFRAKVLLGNHQQYFPAKVHSNFNYVSVHFWWKMHTLHKQHIAQHITK